MVQKKQLDNDERFDDVIFSDECSVEIDYHGRLCFRKIGQLIFPDAHRFQQDNEPKHTSLYAREFMAAKNVNWWKTPAKARI